MFKNHILLIGLSLILLSQGCGVSFKADETTRSRSVTTVNSEFHLHQTEGDQKHYKASNYVQPIYTNRVLTYNILEDVFGPSQKSFMIGVVAWAQQEFGSGSSIYDVAFRNDCKKNRSPYSFCLNSVPNPAIAPIKGASALREGRRIRACEVAVNSNASLTHAFRRIAADSKYSKPPEVNQSNFERVFQLFFRGKPLPDPAFFDQLNITMKQAENPTEGWRSILLTLCLSPHWQVL